MNSGSRTFLLIVGALLIAGATIIFLRDLGSLLPPLVSAALAFAAGVGMLWVAFRPERFAFEVRDKGPDGSETYRTVDTSYDRAAMVRLQEAFDADAEPPDSVRR